MAEHALRRPRGRPGGPAQSFAVRRRQPTPRRLKILRIGAVVLAGGLLGGGLWWALTARTFAVAVVRSGAYRFTAKAELDSALSLFLGRNIWTLREREVAEAVGGLDWVRDLRVIRRLPDTIEVDFREWRPLGVLAQPDPRGWAVADSAQTAADGPGRAAPDSAAAAAAAAAYAREAALDSAAAGAPLQVLSESGRVLAFPPDMVLPALPTLVGMGAGPQGLVSDADTTGAAGAQVLELFAAIQAEGLEALCPVDFVVAGADGYAIVLQERQGTLLLGREDFAERLRRYMVAREHLEPGAQVDLRFAGRVTVKPAAPPPDAEPAGRKDERRR